MAVENAKKSGVRRRIPGPSTDFTAGNNKSLAAFYEQYVFIEALANVTIQRAATITNGLPIALGKVEEFFIETGDVISIAGGSIRIHSA